jgi:hypothetical protein
VPGHNNTPAAGHHQHLFVLSAYPLDMAARHGLHGDGQKKQGDFEQLHTGSPATIVSAWQPFEASKAWTLLKPISFGERRRFSDCVFRAD